MNIGKKITFIKESRGYKNYQEFGKAVSLPGDWLVDLSKKETVQTVDITRLIVIVKFFDVTLDWLLEDEKEDIPTAKSNLPDDDIGILLDNIKIKIKEGKDNKFYGYNMNKVSQLAYDSIETIIKLIKSNL